MKQKILRIISCVVALSLTLLLLFVAINVTTRKSSIIKYQDFFRQEEDFDVLFFGSSVVINSVMPMQLWNEHGIVSYNFGGHGNYISTSYWVMRNALDYTTPQLAVIDCRNMRVDRRTHDQYQYLHLSLDAFPLSRTKIQAVNDLLKDDEVEDAAMLRSEMLFPFVSYHSRWSSLTKADFSPTYNVEKGAESRVAVATPKETDLTPTSKTITEPSISRDYLERFIVDCQARNIEVLLLYVPVTSPEPYKEESQTIPQIAEQYGVQALNLLQMDVVDFTTDCYDPEPHLNPSGAYKVTATIGDYISAHYNIPNRKEDAAYSHWHEDYQAHLAHKQKLFADKAHNANGIMSLMLDNSFDYILQLPPEAIKNKLFVNLLKNLSVDVEKIPANGGYVLIRKDTRDMEYFHSSAFDNQERATVLGSLAVNKSADTTSIILNGTTLLSKPTNQWDAYNLRLYMIADENTAVCREFTIQ